jgi:hypothetical protein
MEKHQRRSGMEPEKEKIHPVVGRIDTLDIMERVLKIVESSPDMADKSAVLIKVLDLQLLIFNEMKKWNFGFIALQSEALEEKKHTGYSDGPMKFQEEFQERLNRK